MASSLRQPHDGLDPIEVHSRLDDLAADLERLDSRLRPYGDGESDLRSARWSQRRAASRRHFPRTRVGDGR